MRKRLLLFSYLIVLLDVNHDKQHSINVFINTSQCVLVVCREVKPRGNITYPDTFGAQAIYSTRCTNGMLCSYRFTDTHRSLTYTPQHDIFRDAWRTISTPCSAHSLPSRMYIVRPSSHKTVFDKPIHCSSIFVSESYFVDEWLSWCSCIVPALGVQMIALAERCSEGMHDSGRFQPCTCLHVTKRSGQAQCIMRRSSCISRCGSNFSYHGRAIGNRELPDACRHTSEE